jgi:polysaccharide export outer membrane protein
MFIPGEDQQELEQSIATAEENYILQVNDRLKINFFTNKGEQMIDPNFESATAGNNMNNQFWQIREGFTFLVQADGTVKFPVVGQVQLEGLTINEAESKLEALYDEFYKDSFVKLSFENKRVIVLGAEQQVVPLINENTNLIEVLALAGGVPFGFKADNIRLIRGDLTNPQVFTINLGTLDGMQASVIEVQPGDIVYIEPWRRPWLEGLRDASPILGIVTSLSTLVFLTLSITNSI